MTAGIQPSRRSARAAPLPTPLRALATRSFAMERVLGLVRVPAHQNNARPSSRGDRRFIARVYRGNGPSGQGLAGGARHRAAEGDVAADAERTPLSGAA